MRIHTGVRLIGFLGIMVGMHVYAYAQEALSTSGTIINLSASGEVTHLNDEAKVILWIEEQDREKAVAASRVNQKMRRGMEIVSREDPGAILKTHGYYTHAVYPEPPRASGSSTVQATNWRVGQYLEVTTSNLEGLPKLTAAAQSVLALNGLRFSLSKSTVKKLDEQRIEAAYDNLRQRIAITAKAMGRTMSDVEIEKVEFEDAALHLPQEAMMVSSMRASTSNTPQVSEPSFEPGETTLSIRVSSQLRFK